MRLESAAAKPKSLEGLQAAMRSWLETRSTSVISSMTVVLNLDARINLDEGVDATLVEHKNSTVPAPAVNDVRAKATASARSWPANPRPG